MSGPHYPTLLKRLRDRFGGSCAQCGRRESLEFAHVVVTGLHGRGRGSAHRYHDVRRHPESYRLLCRLCHLEFDRIQGPALPKEVPF